MTQSCQIFGNISFDKIQNYVHVINVDATCVYFLLEIFIRKYCDNNYHDPRFHNITVHLKIIRLEIIENSGPE